MAATRGKDAAKELLGETFTGLVGSDRYGGYNWLSAQRRPLCWVHLKRNFKAFLLRYGEPERIGRVTAMVLLTEVIDIGRFKNRDRFASDVGIKPGENSSGEIQRHTGITRRRNAFLRYYLIEAAWVAVRKDTALMLAFHELCKRMPRSQAIIRIARKLSHRIFCVLQNHQTYTVRLVK